MMHPGIRDLVRQRAQGRCEYCRLPEHAIDIPFHIEHIVARQHRGDDDQANLCLACDRCNLYKGPNLTSIDPVSGQTVPLFHPRNHTWHEHFAWRGVEIIARTETGRATVRLLNMNAPRRVQLRSELLARGQL